MCIHLCVSLLPLLSLSLCLRLTEPLPQCASGLRLVLLGAVVIQVMPPARDRLRRELKPSDSTRAMWDRSRRDPLTGHRVAFLGHCIVLSRAFIVLEALLKADEQEDCLMVDYLSFSF